jgi:pimeloyl-ACP methyl ester carboxylesterase
MTPILYLHGFASGPSSNKARYLCHRLEAAGAHVEVPDLAAGNFEHLTITGQLAIVEALARPAGHPEPVALAGSSLGGYLAALYAARHPEVARLVLLAPAFGFARRWAERLGPDTMERWQRDGSMDVFHYAENRLRAISYGLIADAAGYEDNPDFHQPALVFHGSHDDVVFPESSVDFAASHPNVTLEIVDSGHELLNVLDYMAPKIEAFLCPAPKPRWSGTEPG